MVSKVRVDKGYNDYIWYNQLTGKGIFFVTRLKVNAKYRVVSHRSVLKSKGLTSDQTIEFTGTQTARLSGCRNRKALCLFDQQLRSRSQNNCRHIQGKVAGRTIFQIDQTKPEYQIVCGRQ
ncbi:MAG: hypothetical protein P8166_14575 [Candidatus Thiodiazotropha sp.]